MVEEGRVAEAESEQETEEKPEDKFSVYQSKMDKALAAANKEKATFQKELESVRAELQETKGFVSILKERGELSEDEEKRAQYLAKRERELNERMGTVSRAERLASLRLMTTDFPAVPSEVYDSLDDASEMELAALRWERAHQGQPSAPKEEARPRKQASQPKQDDDDGVEPARVDTGSGNGVPRFDYTTLDVTTPEGRAALEKRDRQLRAAAERKRG